MQDVGAGERGYGVRRKLALSCYTKINVELCQHTTFLQNQMKRKEIE